MFVKTGTSVTFSLTVEDENGVRITTDNPYAVFKNIVTGQYFNGFDWVSNETHLSMFHINNGIYSIDFKTSQVGYVKLSLVSRAYKECSKDIELTIYSDDIQTVNSIVDENYTIKYTTSDSVSSAKASIFRDFDNTYFNGNDFGSADKILLDMQNTSKGMFVYSFVPDVVGKFIVEIEDLSGQSSVFAVPAVPTGTSSVTNTVVGNSSISAPDGSDSIVVDNYGVPLKAAKISLYSKADNSLVGQTLSDAYGKWSLVVPTGTYRIIIEKERYISVSFESQVS